jgi:hypothetical protein
MDHVAVQQTSLFHEFYFPLRLLAKNNRMNFNFKSEKFPFID